MLKLSGKLEVFKNQKGYITGVIKAFDSESKKLLGKAFMDVTLPEGVEVGEGETLTLDVKTAYLNAIHVETENAFTKLRINVVDADIVSVYPERKKDSKPSKKVSK